MCADEMMCIHCCRFLLRDFPPLVSNFSLQSIYGDVDALERYEEEEIARTNEKNRKSQYAESRRRGMQQQSAQQRSRKTTTSAHAAPQSTTARPIQRIVGLTESPLIAFILRRHPQETAVDRLKREYIRTSREMTVQLLKRFLGRKLGYTPCSHFQVRVRTGCVATVVVFFCMQLIPPLISNF